jgi:hypothetical protein
MQLIRSICHKPSKYDPKKQLLEQEMRKPKGMRHLTHPLTEFSETSRKCETQTTLTLTMLFSEVVELARWRGGVL